MAERTNIPNSYYTRLAEIESSNNPNAKASTSSATGLYQFTKGTWKELVDKYDLGFSLEDREDPEKSRQVVELFTNENYSFLETKLGRAPNPGELYLAHFLGRGGAEKLINGEGELSTLVGEGALKANKNVFYDANGNVKNKEDVIDWANSKMNIPTEVAESSIDPELITGNPYLSEQAKASLLELNETTGIDPETIANLENNQGSLMTDLMGITNTEAAQEKPINTDESSVGSVALNTDRRHLGHTGDISAFPSDFKLLNNTSYNDGGLLNKFNEGGKHEENPLGGIPVSKNQAGGNNLVEEGETMYKDYIFSDSIKLDKKTAKRFNVNDKYVGKTLAEISERYNAAIEDRPFDKIAVGTAERELDKLILVNESLKPSDSSSTSFSFGGFMDPTDPTKKKVTEETNKEEVNDSLSNSGSDVRFYDEKVVDRLFNKEKEIDIKRQLDLGKYKGTNYFEVIDQGTDYVISPTTSNPQNAQGFNEQLKYLKTLNPNSKFAANTYKQFNNRNFMMGGIPQVPGQAQGHAQGHAGQAAGGQAPTGSNMGGMGSLLGGAFGNTFQQRVRGEDSVIAGDPNDNAMIDSTKDTIAQATGPIGQFWRGVQKAGQGLGDAIGGDAGAGISDAFSPEESTMAVWKDKDASAGEKFLGTVPVVGGIVAKNLREERISEARDNKVKEVNSMFRQSDFNDGGHLNSESGGVAPQDMEFADFGSGILNFFDNNGNDLLRIAPIARNLLRKAPKAEITSLPKLDNRFKESRIDEANLLNRISNATGNTRQAIRESSAGNLGALRSNLLQANINELRAVSDAMFQNQGFKADQNNLAQQFNKDTDIRNQNIMSQEIIANEQNRAAARAQKEAWRTAAWEDIGLMGKEGKYADILRNTTGYNPDGTKDHGKSNFLRDLLEKTRSKNKTEEEMYKLLKAKYEHGE